MEKSQDNSQKSTISVIIPTYNGAETLRELLAALGQQTVHCDEVLVVDSSSTDRTLLIARDFGAETIVIPHEEFDHGGTRSMAARQVKGDILVFMTQDAIPDDNNALEKLVAPILDDSSIGVSYGRQLPFYDASVFAAHLRRFNYPEESEVRSFEDKERLGIKTVFVSNSFAAYPKKLLAEVDYFQSDLIFGEDTCAAGRLLKQGYGVAYAADARVHHSHNYSWRQEFQRSFDIGVLHTSEQWLLKTFGRAEGQGMRYVRSEIGALWQQDEMILLPSCLCRNILKLLGYRLGRIFRLLPKKIVPLLSLHSSWWSKEMDRS
ncbi:MAG: glycosyltransferase family 2 protein [Thermodesulfobacteriota bacterium]